MKTVIIIGALLLLVSPAFAVETSRWQRFAEDPSCGSDGCELLYDTQSVTYFTQIIIKTEKPLGTIVEVWIKRRISHNTTDPLRYSFDDPQHVRISCYERTFDYKPIVPESWQEKLYYRLCGGS